jgi:hypothetical protein
VRERERKKKKERFFYKKNLCKTKLSPSLSPYQRKDPTKNHFLLHSPPLSRHTSKERKEFLSHWGSKGRRRWVGGSIKGAGPRLLSLKYKNSTASAFFFLTHCHSLSLILSTQLKKTKCTSPCSAASTSRQRCRRPSPPGSRCSLPRGSRRPGSETRCSAPAPRSPMS